jgi:hypothetical protein
MLTRSGLIGKVLRRERPDAEPDEEPSAKPEGSDDCCAWETLSPAPPVLVGIGARPGAGAVMPVAIAERPKSSCGTGCDTVARGAEAVPASQRWYAPALASVRALSWREVGRDEKKIGAWVYPGRP